MNTILIFLLNEEIDFQPDIIPPRWSYYHEWIGDNI